MNQKLTLRQARNLKGLTQNEMAKLMNISTGSYYLYEKGKRLMNIKKAKKFAEIVGYPLEKLIF